MWAFVALHPALTGPLAKIKHRTCPIAACHPEIHPEVDAALRSYARWRRFGYAALDPSEGTLQAVEAVADEMEALTAALKARL